MRILVFVLYNKIVFRKGRLLDICLNSHGNFFHLDYNNFLLQYLDKFTRKVHQSDVQSFHDLIRSFAEAY
jgi:hypothetical protein